MKFVSPLVIASIFGASVATSAYASEPSAVPLTIKNHKITAELALSPAQREQGLMNRFSLRSDQGMLFVFPHPQRLSMWMRNTYMPLSVAFIDREGRIINIADMEPQTEISHTSTGPALYALEVRRGWFKERGIGPGVKIEGLERAGKAVN